jgi:hypothetical protein
MPSSTASVDGTSTRPAQAAEDGIWPKQVQRLTGKRHDKSLSRVTNSFYDIYFSLFLSRI